MSTIQEFKAGRHAYVAMSFLFGVFIAISVYGWLYIHESFWKAILLWGAAYVAILIWLLAFKITITENVLVFRSLFAERRIQHDRIALIRLGFDLSHGGGPLRLFVESKDDPHLTAMSINAKVLPRDAIRAVLDLGSRVAQADAGGLDDGLVLRAVRKRRPRKTERDT